MNAYYYLPIYVLFYIFFLKIHMEISRIIEVLEIKMLYLKFHEFVSSYAT